MLALNLKMHLTKDEIIDFENYMYNKKVIIMPQYPYLAFFQRGNYTLGSQDVSKFPDSSFTGEVSAKCLKSFGCKYVMVGHSERRHNFDESEIDLKQKMKNVVDNDMIPVYCVDQDEEDEINDKDLSHVEKQLESIPENVKYIVIVFEPSNVIGNTNMVPDVDNIQKVINKIKEWLIERNINHAILYGGGVSSKNVDMINNIKGIDGTIICSNAFNKEEFDYIYNVCVESKS